ncbi:unnamed protein product [Phaeothamnion confervicola]
MILLLFLIVVVLLAGFVSRSCCAKFCPQLLLGEPLPRRDGGGNSGGGSGSGGAREMVAVGVSSDARKSFVVFELQKKSLKRSVMTEASVKFSSLEDKFESVTVGSSPPGEDDANEDDDGGAACAICLLNFAKGDQLVRVTCAHVFHCECVDTWLARHVTCPLCGLSLETLAAGETCGGAAAAGAAAAGATGVPAGAAAAHAASIAVAAAPVASIAPSESTGRSLFRGNRWLLAE